MKNKIIPFVEAILNDKKTVYVILRSEEKPCNFIHLLFYKNRNKNVIMMKCESNIPFITSNEYLRVASTDACCSVDEWPIDNNLIIHQVSLRQFELPQEITLNNLFKIDFNKNMLNRI